MKTIISRIGFTFVAPIACLALVLTGCGAMPASGGSTPGAPGSQTLVGAQSPEQRAQADAASILASVAMPPGVRKLPSAPSDLGGTLDHVLGTTDPDVVDATVWWQAPGQAAPVLDWEKAHLPSRSTLFARSNGPLSGKNPVIFDEFALPPVPGVLFSRDLQFSAARSASGQTYLRIDAQVAWVPPRSAAERVPAAARVVVISYMPGKDLAAGTPGPGSQPAPVTITDRARVRRVVALVNGLSLARKGSYSCPLDTGRRLVLTYAASLGETQLAVATVYLSGCAATDLTLSGVTQPTLAAPSTFIQQVLQIAGLRVSPYT